MVVPTEEGSIDTRSQACTTHFPLGINLRCKGTRTAAPWQSTGSRWHAHLSLTPLGPQDKETGVLLRKAIIMVCLGLSLELDLW